MLGKRKRTSSKSRRNVKKRSTYKKLNTRVGTNPGNLVVHKGIGIPDRFRTRLSWTESIVLTGFGSSITQNYAVAMNSPYDPQAALGGNQPAYWDQLIALYKSCIVTGAKMTVHFALPKTDTAGDGPYIVGIHTNQASSLPTTDAPTLMSAENTGYEIVQQGGDVKSVTATFSPWNNLGRAADDTQLFCSASGNPSVVWYGNVFASPQGTSTAGSVNAVITIEYLCEFFNLNDVVDS